jgi:hypothetical protein
MEKRFVVKQINTEQVKTILPDETATFGFIKTCFHQMEAEIRKELNITSHHTAGEYIQDNIYVNFLADYDAKLVALSVWKSIIKNSIRIGVGHYWWLRIFELLRIPQPQIPPIVHLIISNNRKHFFEPSNHFRVWMFRMQLKNLFIYIYIHVLLLRSILEAGNPKRELSGRIEGNVLFKPKYQSFRIILKGNTTMKIVYRPLPKIGEIPDLSEFSEMGKDLIDHSGVRETFLRYLLSNRLRNIYDCVTNFPSHNIPNF